MESVGGGGGGFPHRNILINCFQNDHTFFETPSHTTTIERVLCDENNQISQYPQPTLPFSLPQNSGTPFYYYNSNNIVLDSPSVSSNMNANNFYQNEVVSWPSQSTLNFSHGQLLNMEKLKWNDERNILPNLREDLGLFKNNGLESGKNGKTDLIKGQWTEEEDRRLMELVHKHGEKKWTNISEEMYGRSAKQCRERWNNHLRSNIKKEPWTKEEERLLVETHKKLENRWAEIAKMIPGRTENAIKNQWHATKRKLYSRNIVKRKYKQNKNNQATILEDYIMSYYAKKATNSTSHPTTITPSIRYMSTDDFDMFLEDISSVSIDDLNKFHRKRLSG